MPQTFNFTVVLTIICLSEYCGQKIMKALGVVPCDCHPRPRSRGSMRATRDCGINYDPLPFRRGLAFCHDAGDRLFLDPIDLADHVVEPDIFCRVLSVQIFKT